MTSPQLSQTWHDRLTRARQLVRRAGLAFLVIGAVIGMAAGVKVFLVSPHPDDRDVAAISARISNQRDAAGQFAANFVGTVLTTAEDQRSVALQRFLTLPPNDNTAPLAVAGGPPPAVIDTPKVWSVIATGTAGEASLYSVLIMVQQHPYASAPSVTVYYRVPVSIWHFQPRAMDMPTPISAPGPGADITLGYPHPLNPAGPVYAVAAGFITTYLTASSGLDRYVVADSWITPMGGYQSVTIRSADADTEVASDPAPGDRLHVRVTVDAQTSQFANVRFAFPLTVENSGGTWMIADIDLTPQVATDTDTTPAQKSQP